MTISNQSEASFEHYLSSGHTYDELVGEDGNLRPHWQSFFQSFHKMGPAEILERTQDLLRLLKENGVTYNIYGHPSGLSRPWNLDLIPFLISKKEWQTIESGLVQRAELFDLILKDIYGDRKLIKNGLLPDGLVYNHSGFIRQCSGILNPRRHNLVLYSADMARSPDGRVWILNDRTQAPSGSGYALENRIAMARIFPELFDGLEVRQLSSYFDSLTDSLNEIAPGQKQDPRIVILTPGPGNETYFEHSYLSANLGYTLVQGNDLMVQDNFVWLKTIGGLEKVDVILRRVDDVYCDPLEMKEDSQLGVPGLLQVVRSGNVSIANPIGSSILENPGLISFLPNISRYFLNEDLIMPTIASWWCGQPKELKYALDNIESLVIKRIYRESSSRTSIDGASLAKPRLDELKEQIKAHPYLYVAQEKIAFSSTPSLINGKIEPRNALFRSYLVSWGETYSAMPGGLTRTAAEAGNFVISNQFGGMSKDTWIISPEPGSTFNFRKELPAIKIPASNGTLPSHTAENLFWVGRYAERILSNARFQRTVMQVVAEGNRMRIDNDMKTEETLLMALTHYTSTYPGFSGVDSHDKFENPWPELKNVLFDLNRPGSMSFNFAVFGRTLNAVRDRCSADTWRVFQSMEEEWWSAASSPLTHFRMLHVLDNLITSMVAFIGLNRESISREQGWILLDTGRKIELSLLLISMLRSTLVNKYDDLTAYNLQESVLKSNEALANYRHKYRVPLQLSLVLELMLLDPSNPRSLIYQLSRLKAHLAGLPKLGTSEVNADHERFTAEAFSLLKNSDKESLSCFDKEQGQYLKLDDFLSRMYSLLTTITAAISKTYFKHAQIHKQLFKADHKEK